MFDEYYQDKLINKNCRKDSKNNTNNNNNITKNEPEKERLKIEKIGENKRIKRPLTSTNKESRHKKYLEDNKYTISKIQEANNLNKIKYGKSKENPYHKEFGKIPKYIQNMKDEEKKKKEIEKIKKETSKYPKGTRLLSEEERLFTLEKLKQRKNDINQILEKISLTCDTIAFRNKKEELFKKLDEVENAIETFSRQKVFVKIENSN